MKTFTVSKSFKFDAAHYIPGHLRCGQVHGHTWTVTVELSKKLGILPKNGMLLDFHELTPVVGDLISQLDHNLLNRILDIPTCEHLALWFHGHISRKFPDFGVKVTVQEGTGGSASVS
jgi:6-pyruvoyltetrahydropterin/6-carboxytetrahydropterin synthase